MDGAASDIDRRVCYEYSCGEALHGTVSIPCHRLSLEILREALVIRGFKKEGHRKEMWWHNGEWIDDYQLGLLDKEYWATKLAPSQLT